MEIILGILQVIIFFVALITSFYIPGRILLGKKIGISGLSLLISSTIIGMVLWGLQGWIFGYLQIRWMSYVYLVVLFVIFLWQRGYGLSKTIHEIQKMRVDWLAITLSAIGVIAQNIIYFSMGQFTKDGMLLNPFNAPDHIWHISLTNEIVQRFPPYEPGMYGIFVKNYHYLFNLITAEIIRVFHLPLFPTQFIGMYIFGSIMLGFCVYLLVSVIYPSKLFLRLVLFLFYFGGDATAWLTLVTTHSFTFVSQRIEDATIFMDNPPRAFSVLVVLTAAYLLFLNFKKPSIRLIIIMSLLFGTAIGFKVYTGITVLLGLALVIGYKVVKREFAFALLGFLALCVAAFIFIPVNSASGGLFFLPFELPRDFIAQRIVGLHDWELRWRTYYAHNNILRLTQYGLYMTGVYLFAQYGIKLLGFVPLKKMRHILGIEKSIFLYGTSLVGIVLGTFFYQYAGTANIFNFYIAGALFLTFLAGLFITVVIEKKSRWIQMLVILLVVGFVIPRFIFAVTTSIRTGFIQKPPAISYNELASYTFLKNLPKHQMVMVIDGKYDATAPLVSVMTNQDMFLSGNGILDSHGALNRYRVDTARTIETSKDPSLVAKLLHDNNIRYIYFYGPYNLATPFKKLPVRVVFSNKSVTIIQIN